MVNTNVGFLIIQISTVGFTKVSIDRMIGKNYLLTSYKNVLLSLLYNFIFSRYCRTVSHHKCVLAYHLSYFMSEKARIVGQSTVVIPCVPSV